MDAVSSILCRALRDFINGTPTDFPQDTDWQSLISLSVSHSVGGILAYQVLQSPGAVSGETLKYLRGVCHRTVAEFALRAQRMEELSQKLTEEGVAHIPFKGYVLRECYPVPELRTYGDVDFLICPEDRKKTHALMLSLGFFVKTDWEPVYSYVKDNEYYEIHTRMLEAEPLTGGNAAAYFSRVWESASPAEGLRSVPDWSLHFTFLIAHLAKHVMGGGAGVRMYLDLALLMKSRGAETDWLLVEQKLKELGLWEFANAALTLTKRLFGTESPMALRKVPDEVLEAYEKGTLAGGVFGQETADPGVNSMKREQGRTRAGVLLGRAFPPAKELKARYTYLQTKPWLLPAAWVHRAVITRGDVKKHLAEAGSILHADEEKATQLRELYRAIGL